MNCLAVGGSGTTVPPGFLGNEALQWDGTSWSELPVPTPIDSATGTTSTLSGLACAFDNEPTHVNAYKRAFPDARVVHLDTDHSGRPVEVRPDVPSIVDFRMSG